MRIGLLFPLVLLAACAREWVRDYDGFLPGTYGDEIHATWVVDAGTRAPLPGATLRIYRERIEPYAPIAPFVAEFRADRHGMIVVPWEQRFYDCHWVYDHPGYAAQDEYANIPEVVELKRGQDLPGRIVGAPAGVEVEYFLGCPHSPAVRCAVTDADGRFVVRDADPDDGELWAVVENRVAAWFETGTEFDPEWGVNANGRVVDTRGEPVAGVVVYSEQTPRGPRTVTDEHGYFDLDGLDPDAEVKFHVADGREIETTVAKDGAFPGSRDEPVLPVRRIVVTPPGAPDAYFLYLRYGGTFEAGPDGRVVVETTRPGPLRLEVLHDEYGEGAVDIPPGATTLGPDAFPVPGTLIVLGPDGKPPPLLGYEEAVSTRYRFRAGARVRLYPEDRVPATRVLEGESPFVVRLGNATIELRADGAPRFRCGLDGELYDSEEGVLVLRGLDPGPHLLLVGARGRRSKEVRVVLRAGETRRLDLVLAPR